MGRPDTIRAVGKAKWASEKLVEAAIDLARADEDATGVWADSARRHLAEAEEQISALKRELAKFPTFGKRAA